MTRLHALVAALTVACALTAPALAQGTGGAFPDPISTRRFDQILKELQLDVQQQSDAIVLHAAYATSLRALRDGPIDEYLKRPGAGMGGFSTRSVEEVESSLRTRRHLLDQFERAERALFDALGAELTEEQAPRLGAARSAAERQRLRGVLGPFAGSSVQFEMADLLENIEVPAESKDAVAAARAAWEQKSTRLLRELADLELKIPVDLARAVQDSGLTRPDPGNPEGVDQWFRALGALREQMAAPAAKKRKELGKANRDGADALVRGLPETEGREAQKGFIRTSYAAIASDQESAEGLLSKAIKLGEEGKLDAETTAALKEMGSDYRRKLATIERELMDAADARRSSSGFVFTARGADDEADAAAATAEKGFRDLFEKRVAMHEATRGQLRGVVGETRMAEIAPSTAADGEGHERHEISGGAVIVGAMDDGGGIEFIGGDDGAMVFVSSGMDGPGRVGQGVLPTSIAVRERDQLAGRLALTEAQTVLVEALHEEYVAAFDARRSEEQAALTELGVGSAIGGGGPGPDDGPKAVTEQDIDRRAAAFRRAIEQLAEVDGAFFDNLAAVLDGTPAGVGVQAARAARERSFLRRSAPPPLMAMPMIGAASGKETEVEIGDIIRERPLDTSNAAALAPVLARHEENATALVRQLKETRLESQKEIDKFHARAVKVSEQGEVNISIDGESDDFALMIKAQQRISDASKQIAQLNRSTRDEILLLLPENERLGFRKRYARAAWPNVYRDAQAAAPKLEAAMAIESLDDAQRLKLVELLAQHDETYEALSDTLIELEENSGGGMSFGGPGDPEAFKRMRDRQNALKKLRFDRTEINATSLRALGAILTPAQIEAVGGVQLPEPPRAPTIELSR